MVRINEEIIETICTELKRGVPPKYASQIAGISQGQFNNWRKKGEAEPEDSTSLYRLFFEETERANALAIAYRVENIRKSEDAGNWRASSWMLEKLAHEEFGKKSVVDANVNANIKAVNLAELFSQEELDKILDEDEDIEEEKD